MRQRLSRRGLVLVLAATAGCGGVLGDDGPDGATTTAATTTATPTDPRPTTTAAAPAPLGTTQSVGGTAVTVTDVVPRDAVFVYDFPDGPPSVRTEPDERWVFVRLTAAAGVETDRMGLAAGGRTVPLGTGDLERPLVTLDGAVVERYSYAEPAGWLAARVPAPLADVSAPTVTVGDRRWRVPERTAAGLAGPEPRYELVRLAVPEAVPAGEPIPVSLMVRNDATAPGTFTHLVTVGEPSTVTRPYAVRGTVRVPAGGERTVAATVDPSAYDATADAVRLDLRAPVETDPRTVTLTDGG